MDLEVVHTFGGAQLNGRERAIVSRYPAGSRRVREFTVLGVAAVAASLSACAAARARPDIDRETWLLIETPHVSLHTDLERGAAIERAVQLEQFWQVLARMYRLVAPRESAPPGRFPVIHFGSCLDYRRFGGGSQGFVFQSRDWMSKPIAVTCEGRDDFVLVHELAHIFNHHFFSGTPPWVQEGLATYYSSITVRGGHAVIGSAPQGLATCRGPSLEQLRRMDHQTFYANPEKICANYYSAWKLVHLLSTTDADRRQRFRRYLAMLSRGAMSEEAWAQAFGDLPVEPLEADYDEHHRRARLNGWSAPFAWSEPPSPRVRPLRPRESHLLWAQLLAGAGRRSEVAEQLERLSAVDPDWPDLLYWRAVLLRGADSIASLRDYVARRPDDERGWRALVGLRLEKMVPADYLGVEETPLAGLVAMEADVKQLAARSSEARSFRLLGWYYAVRKQPIEGLRFATRAVKAEPDCGSCWDTFALLFYQLGKLPQALRAQERAASRLGHGAGPDVLARLRHYREAAAASK